MAKFVFTYRMPPSYTPGQPETLSAWGAWFAGLGGRLADQGQPTYGSTTVGSCGADTNFGGYSLVEADDLEAAVAMAQTCPALADGGGVEIAATFEFDPAAAPAGDAS